MKLKHLLTGTILTVSLLAATAITALAAAPKGRFETVNSATVNGWAYNSSMPDDMLNVRIPVRDKNTGERAFSQRMIAGEYSDELYDSGKGNGYRALTLSMDRSALSDSIYLVESYVGGNDFSDPRTYADDNPDARQETPATQAQNLVPLGMFRTAGYCSYRACSEGRRRHTCIGAMAMAGHTITVNPRVIPHGSKVVINGVVYTAEDHGRVVRSNHIDIFFSTYAETRQHGTQSVEIYLV